MGPRGQDQGLGASQSQGSDLDFRSAEHDGWEIPWPISYNDITPYYLNYAGRVCHNLDLLDCVVRPD